MKIKFNGVIEKQSRGCSACGKARSETSFQNSRMYILPSGITKTFRAGRVEEVSDEDGAFLLTYTYTANGVTKKVFEKWE